MKTAYLGLGSNVGDRRRHLQAAVEGLGQGAEVVVQAVSPVYVTEPHTLEPEEEQPAFLNAVVEASVGWAPERLLGHAQALEEAEGRTRETARWAPRPLDVDLLAVGGETRRTERLTLPHPRLAERRFVLRPWADLAPDFVVPPPFDAPVRTLLERCPDTTSVRRLSWTLTPDASGVPGDGEGDR